MQSKKTMPCRQRIRDTQDKLRSETKIWLGFLHIDSKTEFKTSRLCQHPGTLRRPREIHTSSDQQTLGLKNLSSDRLKKQRNIAHLENI